MPKRQKSKLERSYENRLPVVEAELLAGTFENPPDLDSARASSSSPTASADTVAFAAIDFARMVEFRPADELTHIARWIDVMRPRPAASAGL